MILTVNIMLMLNREKNERKKEKKKKEERNLNIYYREKGYQMKEFDNSNPIYYL